MKWLENIDLKQSVHSMEDAILVLSGPTLAISGIIAGLDLLTGGHAMQSMPALTFAWAITLLISLDFQVLTLGVRSKRVYQSDNKSGKRKGFEIGLAVLIAASISYVSVQMQSIIALVNASGIGIEQATSRLGISPVYLTWERSALVLVLIFLSGWFRDSKSKQALNTPNEQANTAQLEVINQLVQKMETLTASVTQITTTVTEVKEFTQSVRYEQAVIPEIASSVDSSLIISPSESNESNRLKEPLAASPKRGLIKEAIIKAMASGEKLDYKAIAQQTGAGYSTVKLYAPEIKLELEALRIIHEENR